MDIDPSELNAEQLRRLVKEWRLMRDAVRGAPVPFVIYDEDDFIVEWNLAYEQRHVEAFAENREAAENGTLTYRQLLSYQIDPFLSGDEAETLLNQRVNSRRESHGASEVISYIDGEHFKVYRYQIADRAVAGFAMDIGDLVEKQTQLDEANQEIERFAYYDELTGLPNRRLLVSKLEERRLQRPVVGEPCVVLHIDLDWFKQVNDLLGHAAGDHILKEVATILKELCRPNDLAVRVGGDEFVLVMIGDCDAALAGEVAEQITQRLKERIYYKNTPCRVRASIGVSEHNLDDLDIDNVFLLADLAMYRAKQNGGNRVEFFTENMQDELRERAQLRDRLLEAIEQEQFIAYYQPQFRCDDGTLSGVEALVRWKDSDGTIHEPARFIDVATKNSLLGEIDRAVFNAVSKDLEWVNEAGFDVPKISLNVGFERLLDAQLIADLVSLKRPGRLVAVELIETLSLDDLQEELALALELLRINDIAIEIDDFGSKRASINSLVTVSPSLMKIDQQIIRPAPESSKMRELVKVIVEMGSALDIGVLAEGVSTPAHVEMVSSLGCGYMQGFGLSVPLPKEKLLELLEGRQQYKAA